MSPGLQRGYTRVPNALLMSMVGGQLHRSEMQVALLIGRLTISYQQRFAPISKAVIERQTGLRGPAVLQALSDLLAKGLIEKIAGDQHRPNQFGLVGADECLGGPSRGCATPGGAVMPGNRALVTGATGVAAETPVPTAPVTPVATGTHTLVPAATDFKERERYQETLSQLPVALRRYFNDLRPQRKRESEWGAYQELSADFPNEDIVDCLDRIQRRGIGTGETRTPCHSPLSYLAKAMREVLAEVEADRAKVRQRIAREQRQAAEERGKAEAEAREQRKWAVKERGFIQAFPSEERQREVIAELIRGMPFAPKGIAGRVFAINRWFESSNRSDREKVTQ